jgi:hypothetical protein
VHRCPNLFKAKINRHAVATESVLATMHVGRIEVRLSKQMVSISKQNDVKPSSIKLVRKKSLSFGDCEKTMIEDSFAVLTI